MKTKVLIIDDNNSILEYLKAVLRHYNFDIQTSTNGYDGLRQIVEFKPNIIFLDLMMPNIDGLKLLNLKKAINEIKDIPVIVISANTSRKNMIAAIEAGADRVLAKPLDIELLKSELIDFLEGDLFDCESNSNVKLANQINDELPLLIEKFDEYKKILSHAIENRDSNTIKEIISLLHDYAKDCSGKQKRILEEIVDKQYEKPSDWMYAEMKIKELSLSFDGKLLNS